MNVVRPLVSYADLQRAPEDGRRYELYDGEVFVVPAPVPRHQIAAQQIEDILLRYQHAHGGIVLIAPIDIVFSEFDVLQPDVVFFERSRAHLVRPDDPIRVPPDLAVEVLSPSTSATDRGKKMQIYARHGVNEYWLVDPRAETAEVHALVDGSYSLDQKVTADEALRSAILPDLSFPASEMFGKW